MARAMGLLLVLSAIGFASADTIYQTGFEPNLFAVGPLRGQNGWTEQVSLAGTVTHDVPASGMQAVWISGQLLSTYGQDYFDENIAPASINPQNYASTSVQVDTWIEGPTTGPNDPAGDLISSNLAVHGDGADYAEIWTSSNGNVYTYAHGVNYVFSQPVSGGVYHTLGMMLDRASLTVDFFVDGSLLGSTFLDPTYSSVSDLTTEIDMVGLQDQAGYDHTQYVSHFDNFNWTASAVPEPATLAVLSLGLASILRRRRSAVR